MVAFHYPPCQSAGTHRTEKFAQYLKEFGWDVVVLTVPARLFTQKSDVQYNENALDVERTYAFDAAKKLSFKGKYLGITCVPDRWWSWALSAIPAGKKLIEKYKPDVIWSTYPISTAHFIAYKLHKHSGLPWIADYRDPLQCRYDPSVLKYSGFSKYIEKLAIENCARAVFTTKNARSLYQALYTEQPSQKFAVIENGYDEEKFADLEKVAPVDSSVFTLLHSGDIYGLNRNPHNVLSALSLLKNEGVISKDNFRMVFRGISDSTALANMAAEVGVSDLVELLPVIGYAESLSEMLASNALLLLQGELFNNQVPSKLYDYIRAGKPVVASTPDNGATADVIRSLSNAFCGNDVDTLKTAIIGVIQSDKEKRKVSKLDIQRFSRYSKTVELAALLNDLDS